MENEPKLKFDSATWRRLKAIGKPFFLSDIKWKAAGLFLLIVIFALSVSGLNVVMSYIGRDFMTALSLKERDQFMHHLWRYLLVFAAATPIVVFYRYTEERLGLMWRRWLSHHLIGNYFKNKSYLKLHWYGGIDNPDQRIEEDIRTFAVSSLSFMLILFNSILSLIAFVSILSSISYLLPTVAVAYALGGSILAYLLGRPLITLNFMQLRREADYRYKLINVRDNAESIAFYRGEQKENTRVRQKLKAALKNLLNIINWNRNLNFFTTGYNYFVTILPTIVVAPLYLDGTIEFGQVTQAGMAFGHVLGALSIIVLNFGGLSAYVAVITRLGTFVEALEHCEKESWQAGETISSEQAPRLEFKAVNVYTPRRDQLLLKELSINFEGKSLLITGPSGSGKSSLFRVISGLWTTGSGVVVRPNLEECMFLSEKPYMVLGSLRSQFLYGSGGRQGILDSELMAVAEKVKLTATIERVGGLDGIQEWSSVLATGEQQRIAFARLVLAKPKYAFLDEATTALDRDMEEHLYNLMKDSASMFVSVGYHASLSRFHEYELALKGDGTWDFSKILH